MGNACKTSDKDKERPSDMHDRPCSKKYVPGKVRFTKEQITQQEPPPPNDKVLRAVLEEQLAQCNSNEDEDRNAEKAGPTQAAREKKPDRADDGQSGADRDGEPPPVDAKAPVTEKHADAAPAEKGLAEPSAEERGRGDTDQQLTADEIAGAGGAEQAPITPQLLCLDGTEWEGIITIPGDMGSNTYGPPEQVKNRLCQLEFGEQQQLMHGFGSVDNWGDTEYIVKQSEMQPARVISREGASLVWQTEGTVGWEEKAEKVEYTCRGQITSEPRWGIRGEVCVTGGDTVGSFELWLTQGAAMLPAGAVAQSGCVIDDASMRAVTALDIERMLQHMERRMQHNPNIFKVKRPWGDNWGMVDAVLEHVQDVCLYDICQYLVMPACLARQSSIMEEISNEAAAPDFFISQYVQLVA